MIPDIGCRVFDVLDRFLGTGILCPDTKKEQSYLPTKSYNQDFCCLWLEVWFMADGKRTLIYISVDSL